jgi:GNAT superfamily N-acetyltransferase
MSIIYRLAERGELQCLQELIVSSINDLTKRHGFGAMASVRPPAFQLFSFDEDPRGFLIAENAGETLGSAFSWVCGDLWFLAELFIAPGHQGSGIGRELLRRALTHADQVGAKKRALITFAFNTVSQGLYMRNGLFPRLPLYMFGGEHKPGRGQSTTRHLRVEHLTLSEAHISALSEIDMAALGTSRARHHKHLLCDLTIRGFLISEGGDAIGYAYVSAAGHVGPLAVKWPAAMKTVLELALDLACDGEVRHVSAFLPGDCEAAIGIATTRGMRIVLPMVLVSDREFGDWQCYLPRNPGFM